MLCAPRDRAEDQPRGYKDAETHPVPMQTFIDLLSGRLTYFNPNLQQDWTTVNMTGVDVEELES